MTQLAHKENSTVAFTIFTKDNAPDGSKEPLSRLEKSVGMIPNLAATMAGSPALLDGFVTLREIVIKKSSFNAAEREILFLANATANDCQYCQCVHSMFAQKAGLDVSVIDAIRNGKTLEDSRLDSLVNFTKSVAKNRGHVSENELQTFFLAGFSQTHVLDVVACFAQSIMANYTNHIAHVELDEALKN